VSVASSSATRRGPVLIAAALNAERAALEALAANLQPQAIPGLRPNALLLGNIDATPVALLRCGVGKVAASAAVAAAMRLEPRCVISVGSAGALHAGHAIGDVVIGIEVVQHDFAAANADGFSLFGYASPRADGTEVFPSRGEPVFSADEAMVALAREAAARIGATRGFAVSSGRIATGDWFVTDAGIRDAIAARTGAELVEMEGAAIAYVAAEHATPWMIIRSVSDAGDGSAPLSFETYLRVASENAAAIVREILATLL
jgi:adenosylhomocysteine nucleosidase